MVKFCQKKQKKPQKEYSVIIFSVFLKKSPNFEKKKWFFEKKIAKICKIENLLQIISFFFF
jgi:hypothetical protein